MPDKITIGEARGRALNVVAESPRDFAAQYRDMLASRCQPIIPAVVGRLIGNLLDEVGRLRARVGELEGARAGRADDGRPEDDREAGRP